MTNYLNGDFLKELIPLFPFYIFKWNRNRQNYFYILKLIRVERGINFLNKQQQSNFFKDYQNMHLRTLIKNEPAKANSQDKDYTLKDQLFYFNLATKFLKLLLFISCTCYYFAMFFKFCLELQNDYCNWD